MKFRLLLTISSLSLLTLLAMPALIMAQEEQGHRRERPPHYSVTDLGTLGGTFSAAFEINNVGWVAGSSNLTAGGPQHAWLWYGGGHLKDLGTLGGPNSGADGPNARGEAAVGSETSKKDPHGEDFCEYGTHFQCLGAVWKNGADGSVPFLTALPTLPGGNNANAFNLNNRGQVVGFAENGIRDSTCAPGTPFQVLRYEAVIWEPNGEIRELPPLPGDTVGFATGINESGEAVGTSGLCSSTSLPPVYANGPHAVLWDIDGTPHDLGSLGGKMTNAGTSINNRGEVVGASQSSKDGNPHAFLWTKDTGMQDLGTLPGDVFSVAPCCNTNNDRGEVVGFSCDSTGNCRAFLWRNNDRVMRDLNALIPADSPWYLQQALSVNDAGEIVGQAMEKSTGDIHAFLATPCERDRGEWCGDEGQDAAEGDETTERSRPVLSENARMLLQQQLGRRYHIAGAQ